MKFNKMNAAVIVEPMHTEIKNISCRELEPGEMLVKIKGCGVCASNLPVWEGRNWFSYPREPGNPGHEAWGYIEKIKHPGQDRSTLEEGDLVSILSDHAFAQYDIAKISEAVYIPENMRSRPFPGEPIGCAINVIKRSMIKPGDHVAIIGMGFMGLLLTELASLEKAHVYALSRRELALEKAQEMGAEKTIKIGNFYSVIKNVEELTNGAYCDVVIEATGVQSALDLATELVGERKRIVIAGYHQDGMRSINLQSWNWKGIDVINAHERSPLVYKKAMNEAITLVLENKIHYESLITHNFKLDELDEAFQLMKRQPHGFIKGIVEI